MYMTPIIASQAIQQLSEEVKHHLLSTGNSPETHVHKVIPSDNSDNPLWSNHESNIVKSGFSSGEAETASIPSELKLYLQQGISPRNSDPLKFWQQSESCMPGLSYIARKNLTLHGSSVPSERLVSTLNDIVSNERCRLTDQHITERVFMNRIHEKY